jgi:hydroxymethylpyrimidine pyrophosphatase-like HAD family hydrolase
MNSLKGVTLFLDIDGTLIDSPNRNIIEQLKEPMKVLPGVLEKLTAWDRAGCTIILTTGRPSGYRARTEEQLKEACIPYEQLIMGLGGKARIVVNDAKPDGRRTAYAYCLTPNIGLEEVNINSLYQENPIQVTYGSDLYTQEEIDSNRDNRR